MIGTRFGMLVVTGLIGIRGGQRAFRCRCDCGKETIVLSGNLKKGNSKSCGCVRRKKSQERMKKLNLRHGETDTKLWRTWKSILDRTENKSHPSYHRYGGIGIVICDEWRAYEDFAKHVGQPPSDFHSIDRIDNSKGYEPGNVRWATAKEQAANRSTNIRVIVDGEVMILSEAAKMLGISKSTATRWVKSGKIVKHEQ